MNGCAGSTLCAPVQQFSLPSAQRTLAPLHAQTLQYCWLVFSAGQLAVNSVRAALPDSHRLRPAAAPI